MVVFVVKRYAVREAEKWRYAVRKAKIGRYAVRKGGGGCHPQYTFIDFIPLFMSFGRFFSFKHVCFINTFLVY